MVPSLDEMLRVRRFHPLVVDLASSYGFIINVSFDIREAEHPSINYLTSTLTVRNIASALPMRIIFYKIIADVTDDVISSLISSHPLAYKLIAFHTLNILENKNEKREETSKMVKETTRVLVAAALAATVAAKDFYWRHNVEWYVM